MEQVFSARTTDGTSDRIVWYGGPGTYKVSGTFHGGETVTLQCAETGGTLLSCGADTELTAAGVVNFALWPRGGADVMDIAVNIAGAGGTTSIDAFVGTGRGCRAFRT